MRKVSSKAPRRMAALFVASAAVLVVAACGDSSDDSSGGGNGNGGNNAFSAYQECLQKNGVTITMGAPGGASAGQGSFPQGGMPSGGMPSGGMPGGDGGQPGGGMGGIQKPDDVDDATWQKAQEACASVQPSFGGGQGRGNGGGSDAAYENCLKSNGVTDTSKLDSSDATTKKALETCEVLKPQASATPSA